VSSVQQSSQNSYEKNSKKPSYPLVDLLQSLAALNAFEQRADHHWQTLVVQGITLDSRRVQQGMLFVALAGTQQHGLHYAKAAQDQGAVAILWEKTEQAIEMPELAIPSFGLPNLRQVLGRLASLFYGHPSQSLHMIGITGTDGKTSVSHFIAQALQTEQSDEKPCAVIGTIGIGLPHQLQTATHTTPDVLRVHQVLAAQQQAGVGAVAMEVSSHALDQARVNAVAFNTAVFTNLTRDHLDYHKTLEAYAAAKAKLFYWSGLNAVVLNLDDAMGQRLYADLIDKSVQCIGYRIANEEIITPRKHELIATQAHFDHQGIHALVSMCDESGAVRQQSLHAKILGRFNLSNLLATLGALLAKGLRFPSAIQRLSHLQTVTGRMQKILLDEQQNPQAGDYPLVVVDYAHTAGALASALQALQEHTEAGKRLICVFGCGGDRDQGKRPLMAQAAEQYADVIIVTDDNPRSESPEAIFADIKTGFTPLATVTFEHDRALAINLAIQQAVVGDVVLIAGKGHETVQIVADQQIPFADEDYAKQALARMIHLSNQNNVR
jgi:UDP-N-acetylmuramoyl-L-alanyl-D-glutamate--2,6-diaminopimelate ligase